MRYQLKSRNRPVPGGCAFYDSATNYRANQYEDFEAQCRGVQAARIGNPGLTKRYRKSTDMEAIRNEVDEFWAHWAHDKGYGDFYITLERAMGGGAIAAAVPFHQRHRSAQGISRAEGVVAGGKTIYEWIKSKEEAVPLEISAQRAAVCAVCPRNQTGSLLDYFEIQAAKSIARELERSLGWNLTTPSDEKLGVCVEGCWCVNRLSVHCPLETKLKHMPKDAHDALHESCWVLKEENTQARNMDGR